MSTPKKGIVLEQNKEPALSRGIRVYPNEDEDFQRMETPPVSTPSLMAPHEIIRLAWAAQILDETDGRRLYKKLPRRKKKRFRKSRGRSGRRAVYFQPDRPALWLPDQLVEGIALASRATGAASRIEILP